MKHWSEETAWQPLSDLAARLKARAEACYRAGQDADGAHDELIAVEHRLRMAQRRRADG